MKKFLNVLVVAFFCFVLVMSTGTYIFLHSVEKKESSNSEIVKTDRIDSNKNERVNVLILGVDAEDFKSAQNARTDTMMLATFDIKEKKVDIISIPRDTRTVIRGRKKQEKINHAHAYGGVDLSVKTVKDFLSVPVNYYVKINYKGLSKIIDDIGGIEVDVPMDMKYYDPYAKPPLKINLKKGKQILDSNKAMQFVRFRKGYKNQDLGRIEAQHEFLKALSKKMMQPQTIIKLPTLLKTFKTYVQTDIPISKMTYYAMLAKEINMEDIHMYTVPGEAKAIDKISYYIPDMDKTQKMLDEIFKRNESKENNQ
ncbi:LCP family protein [Lutibacter sp. B2]|nr:LCP family protein [Lutibacter sp. B2]